MVYAADTSNYNPVNWLSLGMQAARVLLGFQCNISTWVKLNCGFWCGNYVALHKSSTMKAYITDNKIDNDNIHGELILFVR